MKLQIQDDNAPQGVFEAELLRKISQQYHQLVSGISDLEGL